MTVVPRVSFLVLLAVLSSATLAACGEPDPNSEVAKAEKRGADYAWEHEFKRTTDCGALEDVDERQGCAKWVNNHKDD